MKKCILACLLAFTLATPAFAAVARTNVYDNQFSDLEASSTFYDNVVALYEYGLSIGKADGSYDLTGSLTLGEAVVFSARVRSLLTVDTTEGAIDAYRQEGQGPYDAYYLYLQTEADLDADFSLYALATRGEMAHILVQAMPAEQFTAINQDVVTQGYALGQYITDMDAYTPYYNDILTLYLWGISAGYDEIGSFKPSDTITRGATAAFVTRLVDEDLRITLDWTLKSINSAQGITLADLVEAGVYIAAPTVEEEMDQSVRYMLSQGSNVLELQYDSLTQAQASTYMQMALGLVKSYCEQSYNGVSATYTASGFLSLTFGISAPDNGMSSAEEARAQAMAAAIVIHDQLWDEGTLYDGMSQWEIALEYYQWLAANVTYDYSADDYSSSHLPYSALTQGSAVCDGYTGAYNLFLKLEGIDCYALSNSSHIWTVATLDGTEYHIDATWGDKGSTGSMSYFAMSESQSRIYHSW
ncbi:S-layer homology domain-containing protein [Bengtsoniella intestinalis]|uniref:S-layer homology domain-containing protein n=1 Tax=Bengtsoniella intestinalis TaxID=3073143 RepID=UPI00391F917B